jgi:hypothetical protein
MTTTLPAREYLTRKAVLSALGGWRRLKHAEATGQLRRYYPLGLKHARYSRREVKLLLDGLSPAST